MMPTNFNNDKFSPSNMLVFQVDCAEYKRKSKLSYFSIPFTDIFAGKKVCGPKTKLYHHCVLVYISSSYLFDGPYAPILLLCIYNNSYNPIIALSLKKFPIPFIKHLFVWVFCNTVDICVTSAKIQHI